MPFLDDLADYLEDQAIGTVDTDIFVGLEPSEPHDVIALFENGGAIPSRYIPTGDPSVQIVVRNNDYAVGTAKVEAIVAALHQLANVELQSGGTYLYFMALRGEPAHIGKDAEGRDEWSINLVSRIKR